MWVVLVWFCKSVLPTNPIDRKRCNQAAKHQAWRTPKQVLQEIWRLPWSDTLLRQEIDVPGTRSCRLPQPLQVLQPPTFPMFIHFNFLCSHLPRSKFKNYGQAKGLQTHPNDLFEGQGTWQVFGCHSYPHPWLINRGISVWHCNSMFTKTLPHLVEYSWGTAFHFLILSYSSIWFFAPSIRPEVCPKESLNLSLAATSSKRRDDASSCINSSSRASCHRPNERVCNIQRQRCTNS